MLEVLKQVDLGLALLALAITFWAWFNGRQTKKMLKEWRDEDVRWRQEWQKRHEETLTNMQKHHDETLTRMLADMQKHHDETLTRMLADMQKHHDETIKYIADLIVSKK